MTNKDTLTPMERDSYLNGLHDFKEWWGNYYADGGDHPSHVEIYDFILKEAEQRGRTKALEQRQPWPSREEFLESIKDEKAIDLAWYAGAKWAYGKLTAHAAPAAIVVPREVSIALEYMTTFDGAIIKDKGIDALVALQSTQTIPSSTIEKVREALELCAKHGPEDNGKIERGIACGFCDMGAAGYASRGDGYHDDDCGTALAQKCLALLEPKDKEEGE